VERVQVKQLLQEGKGSVTDGTQLTIQNGMEKNPRVPRTTQRVVIGLKLFFLLYLLGISTL